MKQIWKYPIELDEQINITMPTGAQVLAFQTQYGAPTIWALIDPSRPSQTHQFRLYVTGQPFSDEGLQYRATIQLNGGEFVFHLFEVIQ